MVIYKIIKFFEKCFFSLATPSVWASEGCTCAGRINEYGQGGECLKSSGYPISWYNGVWCYSNSITCRDVNTYPANNSWEHGLNGYFASRTACGG